MFCASCNKTGRGGEVLAVARLVGELVFSLVEVPLAGAVEQLDRVLDRTAIGALRVLHDHGLRVSDDVAVVSFDDIEEGLYTYPRLTTVAPDKEAIARESLRMLNERLEGDQSGPRQIILSSKLVVRESA